MRVIGETAGEGEIMSVCQNERAQATGHFKRPKTVHGLLRYLLAITEHYPDLAETAGASVAYIEPFCRKDAFDLARHYADLAVDAVIEEVARRHWRYAQYLLERVPNSVLEAAQYDRRIATAALARESWDDLLYFSRQIIQLCKEAEHH